MVGPPGGTTGTCCLLRVWLGPGHRLAAGLLLAGDKQPRRYSGLSPPLWIPAFAGMTYGGPERRARVVVFRHSLGHVTSSSYLSLTRRAP